MENDDARRGRAAADDFESIQGRAGETAEEEPPRGETPGHVPSAEQMERQRELVDFHERLFRSTPRTFVTPTLIALNCAVVVWMCVRGVSPFEPTAQDLLRFGANFGPLVIEGEAWRLLSSIFVHIGVVHLLLNMWVLYNLGGLLERLLGNVGFLVLYFAAGLGGSLTSLAWDPMVVSAGASGAIFGVLGAVLAIVVRGGGGMPKDVLEAHRNSSLTFLLYNLVYGFSHSGIDNAAHLGGLVTGFLCGLVFAHRDMLEPDRGRGARVFGAAGVGALVAVVGWLAPNSFKSYQTALDSFIAVESDCLEQFHRVIDGVQANRLSDEEMARRVEEEILPAWRVGALDLGALDPLPGPLAESHENLMRYAQLRIDHWETLVAYVRTEGDAALREKLGSLQAEIESITGGSGEE